MADGRTKRQKLESMANQSVSPHEAEIARKKLAELKEEPTQNFQFNGGIKFHFSFHMDATPTTSGTYYGNPYMDSTYNPQDDFMDGIFVFEKGEFKRYSRK